MRSLLQIFIVGLCVLLGGASNALRNGIGGYSGKGGDSCSDNCHAGGSVPDVEFDGPRGAATNSTASFLFSVTSTNPRQFVAGFDIAANGGTLEVIEGEGERTEGAELTHTEPKQAIDNVTSWLFRWRAPAQEGHYRIFGAGLSANGTGSRLGDESATATLDVFVRAAENFADANCDLQRSAADSTATVHRLGTVTGDGCAFADVDGNGQITVNDLDGIVAALFD